MEEVEAQCGQCGEYFEAAPDSEYIQDSLCSRCI